jgi:hypothetical protein
MLPIQELKKFHRKTATAARKSEIKLVINNNKQLASEKDKIFSFFKNSN